MGQTEKNSVRAYSFRFAFQTRTSLDAFGMSQRCHEQIWKSQTAAFVHRRQGRTNHRRMVRAQRGASEPVSRLTQLFCAFDYLLGSSAGFTYVIAKGP
jgi:hypothetical protein